LPDAIKAFFGDGKAFGVNIFYSLEERLRNTAGALNGFRNSLDDTFIVHYGDVYCELDLSKMYEFHKQKNSAATLVVQPTDRPHDSDVVVLDKNSRVVSVHHKPGNLRFGNLGNAACYILEPEVLDHIPDEEGEFDFIQDVFPKMLGSGKALHGYVTDEFMEDIGTLERYKRLKERLEKK
jgi:mannose-1-phosphate guanylyltransferase/phosphomannomutase